MQSANAVLDAQVQRLKSEKKQLKAYALQQKESAESTQNIIDMWESKKSTLENLLSEILPLREELRSQVKNLEKLKNKYVYSNDDNALDETLVEGTDIAIFSAGNSIGSAEMLSEFAELKGYTSKASAAHSVAAPVSCASGSDAGSGDEDSKNADKSSAGAGLKAEPVREREQSDDLLESMMKKMSAVKFDNLFG